MRKFARGAGGVVVVLFLALAWPGTSLMRDFDLVSEAQRVAVFVALVAVLALQQIYVALPKPVGMSFVEERRKLADALLKSLLADYYEVIRKKPLPVVRANVMLLTKGALGVFGSHLVIRYFVYAGDYEYSNEAHDAKWRKGEGNCGKAWRIGKPRRYDSKNPRYRNAMGTLNALQKKVVDEEGIASWLSVPIRYDDTVVGILNSDSRRNLDATRFSDPDVYNLAEAYARDLAPLCPKDGVKE